MQWSFSLKHDRISKIPQYVTKYPNTGLGSSSNSNLLIFKVIVIVIYYMQYN